MPEYTDEFYNNIAGVALRALQVPVALVSFVEAHRQVFRGRCFNNSPLDGAEETPLSHSICQYVAASSEPLIIGDTRVDDRVSHNLAVHELNVIAYAGVPIFGADDQALGALCAIDHVPRAWTPEDVVVLQSLAAQVSSDIKHRALAENLHRDMATLKENEIQRARSLRYDRHDLRTPLNALLLSVQAIREFGDLNEDQTDCVVMAERNGEVLMSMIDKMLDVAIMDDRGKSSLRVSKFPISDLVSAAQNQVAMLAKGKGITLQASCKCDEAVEVDKDKFLRLIVNLLSNAIKFTPEGGLVSINTEKTGQPGEPGVKVCVRDSGIGISPEDLPRIFDEGFMVDPNARTRHSTGLGLAFCKRVVEAHGSDLLVESEPGKGTAFSFYLSGS